MLGCPQSRVRVQQRQGVLALVREEAEHGGRYIGIGGLEASLHLEQPGPEGALAGLEDAAHLLGLDQMLLGFVILLPYPGGLMSGEFGTDPTEITNLTISISGPESAQTR
jgi:hypothetical protein